LLSISGSTGGSPFATPPATLRGNIVENPNQSKWYPLGYFHLRELMLKPHTLLVQSSIRKEKPVVDVRQWGFLLLGNFSQSLGMHERLNITGFAFPSYLG
jgi:hypothetical protein